MNYGTSVCSDLVPMVTMPGLTEIFIIFQKMRKNYCNQMQSAEVT